MEIYLESTVGSSYRILKVIKAKCRLQLLQVVSNFNQFENGGRNAWDSEDKPKKIGET